MMGMEISQIENTALRKSAEKADEQGNLNGRLDDEEMNVFAKTAYTGSNTSFSIQELYEITGKDSDDEELATTLIRIQACEDKKDELAEAHRNLEEKVNEYKKINELSYCFKGIFAFVGGIAGLALGFGAASTFLKKANLAIRVLSIVAGIFGGTFAGKTVAEKTDVFGAKKHDIKVSQKQAEDFKKTEIDPLKENIRIMELEVAELKEQIKEW